MMIPTDSQAAVYEGKVNSHSFTYALFGFTNVKSRLNNIELVSLH